jgi:hypothetical protein
MCQAYFCLGTSCQERGRAGIPDASGGASGNGCTWIRMRPRTMAASSIATPAFALTLPGMANIAGSLDPVLAYPGFAPTPNGEIGQRPERRAPCPSPYKASPSCWERPQPGQAPCSAGFSSPTCQGMRATPVEILSTVSSSRPRRTCGGSQEGQARLEEGLGD